MISCEPNKGHKTIISNRLKTVKNRSYLRISTLTTQFPIYLCIETVYDNLRGHLPNMVVP